MRKAVSISALVIAALGCASASMAETDFPQKGIWACEEESRISGHDALVQTEVTYPSPGVFHSKGVASLYLSTKREVRVSLDGEGVFTTDGDHDRQCLFGDAIALQK